MSITNLLIYPVTLFSNQYYQKLIDHKDKTILWYVEDPAYFSRYKFHKKKLILHRASMKKHQNEYKTYSSNYVEYNQVDSMYKQIKDSVVKLFDPNDSTLLSILVKQSKRWKFQLELFPSPSFILSPQEALDYAKEKKTFQNSPFYKFMRKKTGYLMTNQGTPEGGSWSFDKDNRKKIPSDMKIPSIPEQTQDSFVNEAIQYVNRTFKTNYGESEGFLYPSSRKDALQWLHDFINKRVKNFGSYQDYIKEDYIYLFHSVLSSSLNTGLLTPNEVCEKVIDAYKKKKTSLASCEGFIRQIISWREYVRMIYLVHGNKTPNFFNSRRKLNSKFYKGTTGIFILDQEIKKVIQSAYSHHIVRLMVFGNIFTMLHLYPKDMYQWFMELFIDSYEWVMWANVYGMGSYADGGITMGRPYLSSSNYLKNMSDYPKGEWEHEITSLYYSFLGKHSTKLSKIYSTSSQVARWRKMPSSKKNEYKKEQKKILRRIFNSS